VETRDHGASPYVLGHSDRELQRLHRQAKLIDPITRQFLIEAGLAHGMRVLDIGTGAGDVAFLAADLVGPTGRVVGVDRSDAALATARTRAEAMSLTNVSFHQSELSEMTFDQPFDAAIGRYVLCFQPDPVSLLRGIAKLSRPGGVILFHEADRAQMRSFPPAPTYDRCCRWLSEVYRRSGVDAWIGVKLHSLFMAAGLPGPQMRMRAVIGGADALDEIHLDADQAVTLAGEIERMGVATASELGVETLVERIAKEMAANQSVIVGRAEIGAWSHA
jgi:SAM-dependent methyltransferase